MKLTLALLFSVAAFGQNINLNRGICPTAPLSGQARVVMSLGVQVGSNVGEYVTCLDLPTGIRYNTTTGKLELALPAAPVLPVRRIQIDRAILTDVPATTTTQAFTLSKTPVANSGVFIFYRSSATLGDVQDVVAAGAGKLISISLPSHRPFTTTDAVTFAYLTEE